MSTVKVELNYDGIGSMLRGSEMKALMERYGAQISGRAGEGYSFRVHDTGQRQAANIYPDTKEAYQDNLNNNTLLKALK